MLSDIELEKMEIWDSICQSAVCIRTTAENQYLHLIGKTKYLLLVNRALFAIGKHSLVLFQTVEKTAKT